MRRQCVLVEIRLAEARSARSGTMCREDIERHKTAIKIACYVVSATLRVVPVNGHGVNRDQD